MTTPLSVYLDNNVWDFLYDHRIDLADALPRDRFRLAITREAEFEIPLIPASKAGLKNFIADTIARCTIRTDSLFGFYDETLPDNEQRYGGFDFGRWASQEELDLLAQQRLPLNPIKRKTGLYKDEADRALALRAIHSVVLSLDEKRDRSTPPTSTTGRSCSCPDSTPAGCPWNIISSSRPLARTEHRLHPNRWIRSPVHPAPPLDGTSNTLSV